MKTSTKTLLVSAIAMACAGGVYAQGAGGSAGGGGGAGGAGGGMRGGNTPSGNTLEQPSIQPGTSGDTSTSTYGHNKSTRSRHNTGGYGSPGTTGSSSGRSTVSPGMDQQNPSGTTGGYSAPQDQTYHGRQQ
jgi:hypothetical protein